MNELKKALPEELAVLNDLLVDLFNTLPEGFEKPIKWSDGVGISVIKKFSDNWASIYKIGILPIEFESDSPRKKLSSSVSYGKETFDGISVGFEHKLSQPIDLYFKDEFFYDLETTKFYFHDKEITAQQLLLRMQSAHERPTKKFGGLFLRYRLWYWRKFLPQLVRMLDLFLIGFLWFISGEKLTNDIFKRLLINKRLISKSEQDPEIEAKIGKGKTISFFGYDAKRWSVVFYCTLHLSMFIIFYTKQIKSEFLQQLQQNNFILLCYIVVTFAFTEAFLPKLLKDLIEKITPKVFGKLSHKGVRV